MFNFFKRRELEKAEEKEEKLDWRIEFARQMEWENEGAFAALGGAADTDNPYERDSSAWNFWLYGYDNAKFEMRTLEVGKVKFFQGEDYPPVAEWEEDLRYAYEAGHWKPRYVSVPSEWRAHSQRFMICEDDERPLLSFVKTD